jgi:hypothetical protein
MDNDRKSDKKNVSVSSLKCNNINVNVNGLELNVLPPFLGGEVAAIASDGETNANSFANNGDGSQINDFRFICINNNNNTVIEAEEEPIPPTPPEPEPLNCEECFLDALGPTDLTVLETYLAGLDPTGVNSLEELCIDIGALIAIGTLTPDALGEVINQILIEAGLTPLVDAELDALVACLFELFGGTDNNARGLAASNTNTDTSSFNIKTSGSLTASSFSSPTIAQGTTEDDLSAMEKITKLKTQWMELIP